VLNLWIKKYYSEKGFGKQHYKWIWKDNKESINVLDETAFNRPKAYNSEYAHKKGKGIRARQFKNPESAICVLTPKGNYCKIVNLRVEQISLKTKAEFLKAVGVKTVYCDKRNLGLKKFGIETKLIHKHNNPLERKFGYKQAIHNFSKYPKLLIAYLLLRHMGFSTEDIVKAFHEMYLDKLFQII